MGKQSVFTTIGLVIGLIAGIALGTAMAESGKAPPGRNMAADTEAPVCGGKPLDTRAKPDKPGHKDDTDKRDDTRPQPTPKGGTLAEIIAHADIPPIPSGDGAITGHVLTATGEPVAGVTVTATSDYPGDRGYGLKTAEERIAGRIKYERWLDEARHTATTLADGSYKLTGLARDVEYGVGASADGWTISPKDWSRQEFTHGDVADFVAEASVALEIRVFLPDGKPATSGNVSCDNTSGGGGTGGTIENGVRTFTLKLGTWKITATGGKHREMTAGAVEVTLEQGVKPEPVVLHLKSAPGIIGTVKRLGTFVGLRASVHLQANPPADPPDAIPEDDLDEGSWGRDEDTFKFVGLTPGRYRLLLIAEGAVEDWEDVTVSDSLVEVELHLPDPAREDYIIVRCYDPAGKPLTDLDFHISYESKGSHSGSGGAEIKQPDGSYWLSKDGVRRGRGTESTATESWYVVKATSGAYGSREVRYETTDTHELEIRFADPALVTLTVANFNDHAQREKLRWALFQLGAEGSGSTTRTFRQPAGTTSYASPFTLGPAEPGEYSLILNYSDDRGDTRELLRQTVTLIAGENALTSTVPDVYTLTITADDESTLRQIDIRAKDGRFSVRSHNLVPKDGKLTVQCVPAGTYALKASRGEMEVIVSSDTTVKFEAKPYDCFVLTIAAGGDVERLGLIDGDKLIKVDGEAVSGNNLGEAQMEVSLGKDSTTWTVLRNGSPTDITFSGKTMLEILSRRGEKRERFRMEPGYRD